MNITTCLFLDSSTSREAERMITMKMYWVDGQKLSSIELIAAAQSEGWTDDAAITVLQRSNHVVTEWGKETEWMRRAVEWQCAGAG